VVDNCEHVLDDVAVLVEQIIVRCPEVTVLATSREALGIAGEVTFRVASLGVGQNSAAAELFAERARAVAPDFDSGNDVEAVAEICRRLDGIPLAIELAASRIRSMSAGQIRDRLDERFRLLTGARRSTERHQTLRQAVQWSYDLLDPTEQRVLQQTSVFAGGFTLPAATAVIGNGPEGHLDEFAMLDVLDSLVRKSLLQVERSVHNLRYDALETIRQFAEERMAEHTDGDLVRDQHAAWFADRAEQAFDDFRSPREAHAYLFVDEEIANLRAAYNWAGTREDSEPAIRIAACTHEIARFRLRTETFAWPAEMVEPATRTMHRMVPLLLTMACDSAWSMGALDDAVRYGNDAIQANQNPLFEPIVWAYTDLAQVALFSGDVPGALSLLRAGASHPADAHDHFVLGLELVVRGLVGDPVVGAQLDDAVARINERGVPMVVALGLAAQAGALERDGEGERPVLAKIQQAVDLLGATGNRFIAETIRTGLLSRLAAAQDKRLALEGFVEIVAAWRVNGDTAFAPGMGHLITLLVRLGDHEDAVRLYGAVVRTVTLDALVPDFAAATSEARSHLGGNRFDELAVEGSKLSYQGAGDLALDRIRTALAPS
jgi:predicted ATPase